MSIELSCQGCGKLLRVPDEHAGKQARCPACQGLTAIPAQSVKAAPVQPDSSTSQASSENAPAGIAPGPEEQPSTSDSPFAESPFDGDSAGSVAAENPYKDGPEMGGRFSDSDLAEWSMRTPEGHTYGPVSKRALDGWLAEGRIGARCDLKLGENGEWQPAEKIYPQIRSQIRQPSSSALGVGGNSGRGNPGRAHAGYQAAGRSGYVADHRGAQVLTLGILGVIVMCPILSVMAWVMGSGDLREMYAGRMDSAGVGSTQAGQILGIIASVIQLIILVCVLFFSLLFSI